MGDSWPQYFSSVGCAKQRSLDFSSTPLWVTPGDWGRTFPGSAVKRLWYDILGEIARLAVPFSDYWVAVGPVLTEKLFDLQGTYTEGFAISGARLSAITWISLPRG